MSIGILGKKIGMTRVYDEDGAMIPVTVIDVSGNTVLQRRTQDNDGYTAVQVGYEAQKKTRVTKAREGHFKKHNSEAKRFVKEFRYANGSDLPEDIQNPTAEMFEDGQFVDIIGTTKGKGFQGVVKRHGFAGVGQATHGQHNRLRAPGSIGAASYPARVFKGMKMAGRMGNEKITIQNLRVLKVVAEKNLLVLKGCVPGHKNSFVIIRK